MLNVLKSVARRATRDVSAVLSGAMGDLACFVLAVVVVAEIRNPLHEKVELYVLNLALNVER